MLHESSVTWSAHLLACRFVPHLLLKLPLHSTLCSRTPANLGSDCIPEALFRCHVSRMQAQAGKQAKRQATNGRARRITLPRWRVRAEPCPVLQVRVDGSDTDSFRKFDLSLRKYVPLTRNRRITMTPARRHRQCATCDNVPKRSVTPCPLDLAAYRDKARPPHQYVLPLYKEASPAHAARSNRRFRHVTYSTLRQAPSVRWNKESAGTLQQYATADRCFSGSASACCLLPCCMFVCPAFASAHEIITTAVLFG